MNIHRTTFLWPWMLLVLCTTALADGVIRDGIGAISSGRGGTNIAHFDNGAILLDNPAGMVHIAGRGLSELSIDGLFTDLDYRDPYNDTSANFKPFGLAHLAYITKSPDEQWAAGIGIFAPAGFGAEFDLNHPDLGEQRYRSLGALVKILPGVAHQVTERLSVGGTLGVAVSHAELEGPFRIQTGPLQGALTQLDLQATGAALSWSAGMQYQLSDRTMFGAAYTSETRFRLGGGAHVSVPELGHAHYDAQVGLVWPQSVGLGLSHVLSPRHRVSADAIWYNWARSFRQLDMQMSNASNPAFTALLGPSLQDSLPLHWRDSISMRLGYEYLLTSSSVLRTGYVYHRNPVPEGTLTPYIPAILEHAFSLGYGKSWDNYQVDLGYQFSFGRPRSVLTSDLAGNDFDSSRIRASAHWIFLGFTRRF